MTSLRSHITAGYKDKLILLKSYDDMAAGFAELDLPALTIHGLFSPNKLSVRGPQGLGPTSSPRPVTLNLSPSVLSEFDRRSPQLTHMPTSYSSALQRRVSTPDPAGSTSDDDIPDRRASTGSRHVTPGLVSSD